MARFPMEPPVLAWPSVDEELEVGQRFEGYTVEGELGRGGMGVVYRVRDDAGDTFALKIVRPSRIASAEEFDERFLREANAASVVRHPGVVRTFAHGVFGAKSRYLVMEHLVGKDLERTLRDGPIPLVEYCGFLREAIAAVEAAHTVQMLDGTKTPLVHRDLKPANVFVLARPSLGARVKVLDFGLVKQVGARALQMSEFTFGTPFYSSPEQLRAAQNATTASDVWAFGVMLFEAVAGFRPFHGEEIGEVFERVRNVDPPRLDVVARGCPAALADLVASCLAKDPEARPAHAGPLGRALDRVLASDEFAQFARGRFASDPDAPNARRAAASVSLRTSAVGGYDATALAAEVAAWMEAVAKEPPPTAEAGDARSVSPLAETALAPAPRTALGGVRTAGVVVVAALGGYFLVTRLLDFAFAR